MSVCFRTESGSVYTYQSDTGALYRSDALGCTSLLMVLVDEIRVEVGEVGWALGFVIRPTELTRLELRTTRVVYKEEL